MKNNLISNPLLVAIMNRSPLSWRWTTIVIGSVLFLLLIIVGLLDGVFSQQFEGEFWRVVQTPVIIIYILVIYPFMFRQWKPAIEAFRPLVSMSENQFNRILEETVSVNRWREWLAVFIGFLFLLVLARPWIGVERWTDAYHLVSLMIMFGLLSWLIYSSIRGSQSIARLSKQKLKLDIFNTKLLTPVARMSLFNSLAFVGGISISLVFQTQESLREWTSVVIYSVLVSAIIIIFYISMWSLHKIMVRVKRCELEVAQKYLADMTRKLRERITKGQLKDIEELSSAVAGGAAYERRIQDAQEWPFNAGIIRRLFASVLAPVSVYVVKIFGTLGIQIGL